MKRVQFAQFELQATPLRRRAVSGAHLALHVAHDARQRLGDFAPAIGAAKLENHFLVHHEIGIGGVIALPEAGQFGGEFLPGALPILIDFGAWPAAFERHHNAHKLPHGYSHFAFARHVGQDIAVPPTPHSI